MTRELKVKKLVNEKKIEKLIELMKKNKLDVIQVETEGEKIYLARNVKSLNGLQGINPLSQQTNPIPPLAASGASTASSLTEDTPTENNAPKIPDGHKVNSPFVGTLYHAPSPESPNFVEVGTVVKQGQTLCIVEAMKLMNEIESDVAGKVVAILADNGTPVEFGTPLFVIAAN